MIRFDSVHKWYGDNKVLDGIDLVVPRGTLFVLCGESGHGKSTLLSTVNGLEPIQRGTIFIDGAPLPTAERDLRAVRKLIGVVYQAYNLFAHMTVEQNIRIGLERGLGMTRKFSIQRAHQYLERVDLLDKKGAYPAELSGGQQQRVAIARCLAMRPKIVLMDEPTSALDVDNSDEVVRTIRDLKSEGLTILLATHRVGVFAGIADELACMEHGRLTEVGSPQDVLGSGTSGSRLAGWIERSRDGVPRVADAPAPAPAAD